MVEMVDALGVERAGAADDAVHLVALGEQQFREIGTVLAGDSGNEGFFTHDISGYVWLGAPAELRSAKRDLLEARGAFFALGGDFRILGEGLVDKTAVEGIHRRQHERLAGAAHLVGEFADAAEKILLLLLAIAFDIDDDIGRALLAAVQNAVEQILQILQHLAVAADQPAGFARVDVEHMAARLAPSPRPQKRGRDGPASTPGFHARAATTSPPAIKECRSTPNLFAAERTHSGDSLPVQGILAAGAVADLASVDQKQARLVARLHDPAVGVDLASAVAGSCGKATRSATLPGEIWPSLPACPSARAPLSSDHLQHLAVAQAVQRLRLAHLRAHIERVVAGQAVGAEADVDAVLAQRLQRKRRVAKIGVALRAMDDRRARARDQFVIVILQIIEMRDDAVAAR